MVPPSLPKHLSNQHPNLDRFWNQLGSILGGLWELSWGQVGTKSLQKSIPKMIKKAITFSMASGLIFDRFWHPTWLPRGGPRIDFSRFLSLSGPSWGHLVAKMATRCPKIAQVAPMRSQNASQEALLRSNWRRLAPSWPKLAPSWPELDPS